MKVGIIGLLPRQQALIQSQFPYLDFSFLTGKKLGGIALRRWSEGMDRIYTMTKFISHTDSGHVDKNKSQLIKGGISALARYLKHLPKHTPVPEKPKIAFVSLPTPKVPTTPSKAFVMKKPTPAQPATPPTKTPEPYEIHPNEQGRFDWTILRAAKKGDRIIVPVPEDVDPSRHFARVSVMKSSYKSNYGVEMTVQYLPDRAVLEVLSNKSAPKDTPAPAQETAVQNDAEVKVSEQPNENVLSLEYDPATRESRAFHAGQEVDLKQPLPEHLRLMTASLRVSPKQHGPDAVQFGPYASPNPLPPAGYIAKEAPYAFRDSGVAVSSFPSWRAPHTQSVPPSQNTVIGPDPLQMPGVMLKNPDEISLWKEVLLMEGGKGKNMDLSAKIADQAVVEYRRRLGS